MVLCAWVCWNCAVVLLLYALRCSVAVCECLCDCGRRTVCVGCRITQWSCVINTHTHVHAHVHTLTPSFTRRVDSYARCLVYQLCSFQHRPIYTYPPEGSVSLSEGDDGAGGSADDGESELVVDERASAATQAHLLAYTALDVIEQQSTHTHTHSLYVCVPVCLLRVFRIHVYN
jgi:hypothetical protein